MKKDLIKYAELIILKGINLQKNQCVLITGSIENYEFLRIVAQKAYEYGAKYVELSIEDTEILKTRLKSSPEEFLKFIPDFKHKFFEEIVNEKWAKIRIDNTENLDALKDSNSKKISTYFKALSLASKKVSNAAMNNKLSWCTICAPGPKWAAKVLNKPESKQTLEEFFEIQKKIMLLDSENPIKAWNDHNKKLHQRCDILNKLKLEKVIFKNQKTNLEIYLLENSIWTGGSEKVIGTDIEFNANMPTQEIFTTPNYKKTNGIMHITRPVTILGHLITGIWLEFRKGKIINFGCNDEKSRNILKEHIETDIQAQYVGEVALVDNSSPVYQSGLTFYNILYDENASCHIALGHAYSSCLSNEQELKTDSEKLNYGCNVSLIHTDLMLGSNDINVIGIDKSGKEYIIIHNGQFVI
ncbi:aminopeptidase [Borrelia anserina]|uniref:Aminopeptidase n=2 Tax=Borrelia anserina TaxID=143 RepID=W5SSL4_BORAN|nr:aminopeptidase [Borrelia anserina]AHH08031.1 Aminopeptidase [Borrelia anserina BA2]APR64581.1 aminopeptidase [Borrelia anserina Es]UPA06494.1 aminopeptidase [Borrelia anserina]